MVFFAFSLLSSLVGIHDNIFGALGVVIMKGYLSSAGMCCTEKRKKKATSLHDAGGK